MKRDPIVLGRDYILPGSDVGRTRPNANALIVGTTGCGKSTSVIVPTMGRCQHSNPVLSYAKEADAYAMSRCLETRGYKVHVLNIAHPERSTVAYDPLMSVASYADLDALSAAIVDATILNAKDDYWSMKAKPLCSAIMAAAIMTSREGAEPGMADALTLFDKVVANEGEPCPADRVFERVAKASPGCYADREYRAWRSLPVRTASCVRDTLAACLSAVFPESIRTMMQSKPQLDAQRFADTKSALLVITSAVDTAQRYYANLFYRDLIHQLLDYAAERPEGELPREVRFIFDDFACTAPIQDFGNDISLFRAAGISAIMLLQSEQQLEAIYKSDAPAIRQNCAVYAYFPGGFDDRSCEIVSRRMGIPYDEVLYAPLGKVFIMQSGRKPVHIPRYDTLESQEYRDLLAAGRDGGAREIA